MKILDIQEVEPFDLWDISVPNGNCFILDNGVVAHNSLYAKKIMSGGCLQAGSKVKMADGTLKEIEKIQENEQVMTLEGPKKVEHTWNPETLEIGTPECYEVEFEDGSKLVCSDRHRFMKEDGTWIHVQDLKIDEELKTA